MSKEDIIKNIKGAAKRSGAFAGAVTEALAGVAGVQSSVGPPQQNVYNNDGRPASYTPMPAEAAERMTRQNEILGQIMQGHYTFDAKTLVDAKMLEQGRISNPAPQAKPDSKEEIGKMAGLLTDLGDEVTNDLQARRDRQNDLAARASTNNAQATGNSKSSGQGR